VTIPFGIFLMKRMIPVDPSTGLSGTMTMDTDGSSDSDSD